mmetsp:Transcript_33953/g.59175  ORF Transcript_33953/g.59175 Transcript_33953/m.59175 type:complete len:594 (-) Transcript_33953:1049-2830(-)
MSEELNSLYKQRLEAELSALDELPSEFAWTQTHSALGTVIKVKFHPEGEEALSFDVILPPRYPELQPCLVCSTHFVKPTVADGRNLLKDCVNWTPQQLVSQWITSLPELITKIKSQDNETLGQFQVGYPYLLSTWSQPDMQVFDATEIDPQAPRYSRRRKIVLTQSFVLFLEAISENQSIGHLVGSASFSSLQSVRQHKGDQDKLTFTFKATEDDGAFSQTFKISKAHEFIELLAKNTRAIGITLKRQQAPEQTLREDEVTAKSLQTINIREVLQAIAVREIEMGRNLSIESINELMSLYQRAIEYYSGVGDPQFDVYLNRMRSFLNKPDVLSTLRGESILSEESKVPEKKPDLPLDENTAEPLEETLDSENPEAEEGSPAELGHPVVNEETKRGEAQETNEAISNDAAVGQIPVAESKQESDPVSEGLQDLSLEADDELLKEPQEVAERAEERKQEKTDIVDLRTGGSPLSPEEHSPQEETGAEEQFSIEESDSPVVAINEEFKSPQASDVEVQPPQTQVEELKADEVSAHTEEPVEESKAVESSSPIETEEAKAAESPETTQQLEVAPVEEVSSTEELKPEEAQEAVSSDA